MTSTLRFPNFVPVTFCVMYFTLHYIPPLLLFLVIIVVLLLCLIAFRVVECSHRFVLSDLDHVLECLSVCL